MAFNQILLRERRGNHQGLPNGQPQLQQLLARPRKEGVKPTSPFSMSLFKRQIAETQKHVHQLQSKVEKKPQLIEQRLIYATVNDIKGLRHSDPHDIEITNKYPISAIGKIVTRNGHGTGCLIGPNLVLTAAQNCFDQLNLRGFQEIFFVPSPLQYYQLRGFKAKAVYLSAEFKRKKLMNRQTKKTFSYDYALLVLDNKLENSKYFDGKMSLESYFGSVGYDFDWELRYKPENNILKQVELFGYPSQANKLIKYEGEAFIDLVSLFYKIQIENETKGAPVVFFDSIDKYWIRGIHLGPISDVSNGRVEVALKLTRQLYYEMNSTIKQQLNGIRNVCKQRLQEYGFLQKPVREWQNIPNSLKEEFHLSVPSPASVLQYALKNQDIQNDYLQKIDEDLKQKEKYFPDQKYQIKLILNDSNIKDGGCEKLSKVFRKTLKHLNLNNTLIDNLDCQFLSLSNWSALEQITLDSNYIGNQGCLFLSSAHWNQLIRINLRSNQIQSEGCRHLVKATWIYLKQLFLSHNIISSLGCEYLSQGKWSQLEVLILNGCNVGLKGCKHLTKGEWAYLKQLQLDGNLITNKGCKYLSKGNWPLLQNLSIAMNEIYSQGFKYLMSATRANLRSLVLFSNHIADKGCEYICKIAQRSNQHKLTVKMSFIRIGKTGQGYLKNSSLNIDNHPTRIQKGWFSSEKK